MANFTLVNMTSGLKQSFELSPRIYHSSSLEGLYELAPSETQSGLYGKLTKVEMLQGKMSAQFLLSYEG